MTAAIAASASGAHAWAWGLLLSRTVLFLVAQSLIAAALAAAGAREPWWSSAAWWPVSATFANLVGLGLLGWRLRVEGVRWSDLLLPVRATWRRDGLSTLALLPVVGLAGALPSVALGTLLWGDPAVGQRLLVGPLPAWAALVALLLFPATTAAVELPTYAGYVLPRLRAAGLHVAAAVALVGLVLGVQHGALPFLPASQFFLWRTTMFVPFALVLIATLAWRPRLLPWFVAVHLLLDALAGIQVWQAAA
jgi:hypothetical protein